MPPLSQVSKGGGDGNLISVFLGASAGAVCCFPGDAADVRAGQAEVADVQRQLRVIPVGPPQTWHAGVA